MTAPPRVSDNPEVQSHYVEMVAMGVALRAAIRAVPAGVTPDRSNAIVAALVSQFSLAAIARSADYYANLRDAAGVRTRFRTPLIAPMPVAAIVAYLVAALATVGVDGRLTQVEAIAQSLVMNAGRNELIAAIEADTEARRWARVTRPGACSFCRMLALRGAVFRTEESANFRAHTQFNGRGGVCRCTIEPVFSMHYEPAAHTRADQRLWSEVTEGLSGNAALNAFRRAVERDS